MTKVTTLYKLYFFGKIPIPEYFIIPKQGTPALERDLLQWFPSIAMGAASCS